MGPTTVWVEQKDPIETLGLVPEAIPGKPPSTI
jgi:hypothetical protein